jgi:hypothetical protein
VLFTAERPPDIGGLIEYIITLNSQTHPSVNLRCIGKVLRLEPLNGDSAAGHPAFAVAATLERYEFLRNDH